MNQIFPLKRKNPIGNDRWYERIGLSYNMTANNTFQIIDSLLFTPDGLSNAMKEAKYSIQHAPSINMSFKILKHINFQPNINYREYWYFYSNEKRFDANLLVDADTLFDQTGAIRSIDYDTTFGRVESLRDYGFYSVRDFSAGVSLNTQIYATGTFNIWRLHKVRAVIRPNVSFAWRPDYSNDFWGYYGQVQTDVRYPDRFNRYSRFDVAPGAGKQSLLNYSVNVRMEGKMRRSKRDTTSTDKFKNIVILNNLNIASSYNLAADSLKMSPVSLNANTLLFKFINATLSMTYDPYAADKFSNRRVNIYEWEESNRLLRLTSASLNLSTGLNSQNIKSLFKTESKQNQPNRRQKQQNAEFQFFQGLNLNYNLRFNQQYVNGKDSLIISANELAVNGAVNLSKGWNIVVSRIGYDFTKKRITYPDFTFSRNLHCWEMGLNWQPEPKTWNFFLRVRPGSLGFINIPMRKTQFDPY